MTNELMTNNNTQYEVGEILPTGEVVKQDNANFTIVQLPDGKHEKRMKYKSYASRIPTDRNELMELYKALKEENSDMVKTMKDLVGQTLEIQQVYTQPYESFDEQTGGSVSGVATTLLTNIGYVATSSKSVYFTIFNLMDVFGYPNTDGYEPIKVEVTSTKQPSGHYQIGLKLVTE